MTTLNSDVRSDLAVVFDMDGVIIDSEPLWTSVRKEIVAEYGGTWLAEADHGLTGMNPFEWSKYIRDRLMVNLPTKEIRQLVVDGLIANYREKLPLIPGVRNAVIELASQWRLGLASSSDIALIDAVLELAEIREYFEIIVSSEEVAAGKPSPDVYQEACRRMNILPSGAIAIEDSTSGIRSAKSAGMLVVAIPRPDCVPPTDVLNQADLVVDTIAELTTESIQLLFNKRPRNSLTAVKKIGEAV